MFFLIVGLSKSIDKFKELQNGTIKKESNIVSFNDDSEEDNKNIELDSLKNIVSKKYKHSLALLDSIERQKIVNQITEEAKDTTSQFTLDGIQFKGIEKIEEFMDFHKKNPDLNIDNALDSLQIKKTFFNRFLYNKAKLMNALFKKDETQEQFSNQLLSYGSGALFIFLPFFALFLKLFYVRKKYTYIDHLVFVFHTQTVFFMLLSIYFILELFGIKPKLWIFTLLFLIYLILAMRKFYQQGYFKTFIKFILLNITYFIISIIGLVFVALISFALY